MQALHLIRYLADMTSSSPPQTACPLARTLELIGDRWSLVILREIIKGQHRYSDFSHCAERIPTNILANRLRRLAGYGVVARVPSRSSPKRHEYHLTSKGAALLPAMQALARWGGDQLPECYAPPEQFLALTVEELPTRDPD
ncbi:MULTISPECIES: winged helix-turn-helix transcriptional regulator [Halomonas]|uniref:Transcriptional regulator n=1 Tax=Halomonas halophila TaxID=29573 RepID=A0ABQ0U729_9GAMM|nr:MULTISPECIES: helix-turn-helix domain-containing protein [Halomonas]MDR5890777.1 helix-turn-helix domain-containing protein [Halomonas salina]WJY08382.1 helix-turn-helix domain-containing protein [Halomonas halophila]GEK73528.1 transcriptional regulator [Halomonas halophila]